MHTSLVDSDASVHHEVPYENALVTQKEIHKIFINQEEPSTSQEPHMDQQASVNQDSIHVTFDSLLP